MTQTHNNKRKDAAMPTAPKKVEPKDSKKSKHDDKDEAQAFLKELEKKKEANPDACIFC